MASKDLLPEGNPRRAKAKVPWHRTAEVFAAALEMPAAQRKEWLASQGDLDDDIRREVASLLEADEKAAGFLKPGRLPRSLLPGVRPRTH